LAVKLKVGEGGGGWAVRRQKKGKIKKKNLKIEVSGLNHKIAKYLGIR